MILKEQGLMSFWNRYRFCLHIFFKVVGEVQKSMVDQEFNV